MPTRSDKKLVTASAYMVSSGVASLCVVLGLFAVSAHNNGASLLSRSEQLQNRIFNFSFYLALFWFFGLMWTLPFRKITKTILDQYNLSPDLAYAVAGGLSGLTGAGVALGIGSALTGGDIPAESRFIFCPLMAISGLVGALCYSLLIRRQLAA